MSKVFNASYIGPRRDIQKLIPNTAKMILDVGCSTGELGASIKEKNNVTIIGIEISKEMAIEAKKKLDKVYIGNIFDIIINDLLKDYQFDVIIFGDVLEHLYDPWNILKDVKKYLIKDGIIIASIPNIRHINTIINLVFLGYWPYRERGIHDRTHLRFFTIKNIYEMFQNADLTIEKIEVNYRLVENKSKINKYAKYFALPIIKNFLAFQYIIKAINK